MAYIQDGQYGRGAVLGKWGNARNVPTTCDRPLTTRGGALCQCVPTWYMGGYGWSCGKHRGNRLRIAPPPPPPPPDTTPFVAFDCAICMSECTLESEAMITQCNHRFHKGCMSKWLESGSRNSMTCPMCRAPIQQSVVRTLFPDLGDTSVTPPRTPDRSVNNAIGDILTALRALRNQIVDEHDRLRVSAGIRHTGARDHGL